MSELLCHLPATLAGALRPLPHISRSALIMFADWVCTQETPKHPCRAPRLAIIISVCSSSTCVQRVRQDAIYEEHIFGVAADRVSSIGNSSSHADEAEWNLTAPMSLVPSPPDLLSLLISNDIIIHTAENTNWCRMNHDKCTTPSRRMAGAEPVALEAITTHRRLICGGKQSMIIAIIDVVRPAPLHVGTSVPRRLRGTPRRFYLPSLSFSQEKISTP
jgi:hypothetical protein